MGHKLISLIQLSNCLFTYSCMRIVLNKYLDCSVNSVAAAAAFREHRIDFMTGIADPFIVANNLYSKNIISRERLDLILTPTLQWNERKIILLDAVEASLQTQPSCFDVLVTTLKWDPVLGIIGSAMKETYSKLNVINPYSNM